MTLHRCGLRGLGSSLSSFVCMPKLANSPHNSDQFHLHWLRPQLSRILLPPMGKPCIFSIARSASGLRIN